MQPRNPNRVSPSAPDKEMSYTLKSLLLPFFLMAIILA
jgi:hypothetical protein